MFAIISWISLGVAFFCAIVIAVDLLRHPQKMGIMNVVWPVTALYLSVFALWGYFRFGRRSARDAQSGGEDQPKRTEQAQKYPSWSQTAIAVSHCGAGCVLADVAVDFAVFFFAWTLWGSGLWASYIYDYLAAWTLGIVFQYFSIAPMRGLSFWPGIWAAIKADTLSITAFQIGMYAWMALTYFVLFPRPHLHPNQPQYWFMMQFAMIAGFLAAYPMNYFLVKTGVKEAMG